MRRLMCFVMVLSVICSLGIPIAAASNPPFQKMQKNEFMNYVYGDAQIGTRSLDSLKAIDEKRHEYVGEIKKVAQNSIEVIKEMGYSEEMTEIILEMKKNPQYSPTDMELSRASATVDMNVWRSYANHQGNSTTCILEWDFSWSSRPFFVSTDILAISWGGDFVISSANVKANIRYVSENNSAQINNVDMSSEMARNVSANYQNMSLPFPMRIETTPKYNYWWAKSGSGSFHAGCRDHNHSEIPVSWAYGHSTIQVGEISITWGVPSISFSFGTSTAYQDYNNFFLGDY